MNAYLYCTFLSLIFMFVTIYYSRKRSLDLRYCIFWLAISSVLIILSINKGILDTISKKIGIYYPPALLFVTGIIFSFLLAFILTIEVSDLKRRVINLTQELAILKSTSEADDE